MVLLCGLGSCTSSNPELEASILNGATLIDVRSEKEFASGSVKGAINIPLDQIEGKIEEIRKEGDVVLFCRSGNRSGKALKILVDNGINTAINGGSWKALKKIKENK